MATYYNGGSEIQADGLQTLYLMNPNYAGYSDTQQQQQQQQPTNMFFLNSAAAGNALTAASVSHAPPPQSQHFVGIPLPTNSEDPRRPIPVHDIPSLQGILPRFHYNLWGTADQTAAAENHPHVATTVAASCSDQWSSLNLRPVVSPTTQQGLSLTLSSRQPGFRSLSGENDNSGKAPATGSGGSSAVTNGISGVQSVILGSKYLKAAQLLLDEVVNVGKAIKADSSEGSKEKNKMDKESAAASGGDGSSGGESSSKRATELTTAQRQEFQMKKAKLVNMLDEVEQRYRQYHHQMQIVVSSFEQAAGLGSAKSYTALALQTISKQFRCLKDAIASQIKATSRSLGEDIDHHSMGSAGKVKGSRLKFVDHQLRQQRAMQQLGMIQHNAWRPQRGLPERAVSVLRAWLFEHFLHPYPKDSDKHILAKQTGLTRSQVSNWFINARVRLWKPMVEEMYLEEVKDQAEQTGSDHNKDSGSKSSPDPQENSPSFQINQSKNTLISKQERLIQEMEGIVQRSPKKPRSYDKQSSSSSILSTDTDTKTKPAAETTRGMVENFGIQRQTRGNYSLMEDTTSHGNGFGAYPIADIGRFDPEELVNRFNGNGVSLTLGLPHCENASQQNFLSNPNIGQLGNRVGIGSVETHYIGVNTPQPSLSDVGYDNISIQNRKIFAAQLLHDFVA